MSTNAMTWFNAPHISPRAAWAHEMKNAMSVILAVSRLVEDELSGKSRERMGRLQDAAWRLRDLLADDLREVVAVSCTAASAKPSRVAAIVEQATDRVADRAAAARVELFVLCGGGELICDEPSVVEALTNLLSNSIDASSAGGSVFLATCETNDGDQYWVVQDAGCGIPAEELAELGQPYSSTKVGGSGLGLALARMVVAAHEGLVRVESCPGAGTAISVWLPNPIACTQPTMIAKPAMTAKSATTFR
jgi:signal transduction histidine kinase